MSTPPISDGYQYYDNFHNNEATTAVASALQFLESGKTNDSNNDSNDDVETPLAKLMNRGEYYRQLRKLIQEDERMRIKDHKSSSSSHFRCRCSGQGKGDDDYDVDSWEEKKDDDDDDCCNNCHNNNNHDNNDYGDTIVGGGQDIIHRNSNNTTTTLMYESYLKHQRYYDDLKHADINFINYGTKFASFLLTGDVHSSSKQRIQGRKDLIIEQRKYLGKGGLCWDAAFILGEHVIHNVSEWRINNNTVEVVGEGNRTTRVVELGAGTGLCGLMIAAAAFDDVIVEITDLLELQDLMCANIKRNFGGNSCSNSDDDDGDDTKKEEEDGDDESSNTNKFNRTNNVSCRVLQWGVKSDYINAPYDVIIGADVVTSIYDPIALAQTFYALSGPHTKIYISGKARLDRPHEIFEMEMKRLFVSVRKIDVPNSRLRSPNVFVLVVQGKQELL
jgi:hypothetical protein